MEDNEKKVKDMYLAVENSLRTTQELELQLMDGKEYKGFKLRRYEDERRVNQPIYWKAQKRGGKKVYQLNIGADTRGYKSKIDRYIEEKI